MEKKNKIILVIIIACTIIGSIFIINYLRDNTIEFTGTVIRINYMDNEVTLLDFDTAAEFTINNFPEEIIQNIDLGCTLNIYYSGRIEIVGECIIIEEI